jgi:hypothetical protein
VTLRLVIVAVLVAGGACDPDLDGTAFKCDQDHGCPSDQSCISGRCRRVAPMAIGCGNEACLPEEQCCVDTANENRCIGATEVCPGATALCDGIDDCDDTERCCNGTETTACALSCESDNVACATDADCPSDAIHCCPQSLVPWGECSNIDC